MKFIAKWCCYQRSSLKLTMESIYELVNQFYYKLLELPTRISNNRKLIFFSKMRGLVKNVYLAKV